MNTRIFGKTGRVVGEVGLGCWQIGGNWGDVSDETALAILRTAFELGTTFYDTADVYGGGRSETLIGKFLKESKARDRLFIATKLGRRGDPGWPQNFTRAVVRQHTEDSLRKLGVDAVDLTQCHCIPPEVLKRGEVFGWLEELKQEGKIKAYGASVEAMDEALIVRLPLASGLLGGKMTKATQFPAEDHRNFNRDGQAFNVGETFAGLPFEKGVELADGLKPHVPAGQTMAEWALRWCLDFEAVSVVIPGAKNPEQARGNIRAGALASLGATKHVQLAAYYERNVAAHIRGPY